MLLYGLLSSSVSTSALDRLKNLSIVLGRVLLVLCCLPIMVVIAQPHERSTGMSLAELSAEEIASRIAATRPPVVSLLDNPASVAPAKTAAPTPRWYRAEAVAQFYEQRHYQLVWIEPALRQQLLMAIESLTDDGLNPEDYFYTRLRDINEVSALTPDTDPSALADRDMLATEAYLCALFHLFNGKVDSEGFQAQWTFELAQVAPPELLAKVIAAVDNGNISSIFAQMRPQHPIYRSLQLGLARYKAWVVEGGWPELPPGVTIKPGITDPQVAVLRERLLVTGEYVTPPTGTVVTVTPLSSSSSSVASSSAVISEEAIVTAASTAASSQMSLSASTSESLESSSAMPVDPAEVYDDLLVEAVKRFQREQYLEADGVVGASTRTALNISAQARVDQIRVNLDRARWLLHNTPDDLLLVDVAGFKVTYFKARQPVWQSRVQVGMAYRTSPLFKSEVNYITLNPTWTVPPTILMNDILPKVQADLGYLSKNNIRVFDSNGGVLDPAAINWFKPGNVTLRQDAGPKAALGQVVIRFPNAHSVYLHDTPHKELFNKSQRAFSSGCIRVERALELAEMLLADTPGWSSLAIDKALATGKTQNIVLAKRVPILLAYWTVDATSDTQVAFKPDIYQRDAQVLRALNKTIGSTASIGSINHL